MEITTNLPIGDWYRNTSSNDLLYWGLDYPPLTAYHSYLCGFLGNIFDPTIFELNTSRGYESVGEKHFMRCTVQCSDLVVLVPSILLLVHKLLNLESNMISHVLVLLFCFLQPGLLLIDHGHFQYNGVCIGLALLASYSISEGRDVIGSILFCLSLNFKQMSLYYALIFFFCLLRKCFDSYDKLSLQILQVAKLGSAVIGTFAVLWLPFCIWRNENETCISSLLHVLQRQFPFTRGIFEDKVSNIWYSVSVVTDIRQILTTNQLVLCSLLLTLTLSLPVCVDLLRNKFSLRRFLLALTNGSLAFFLASYQVRSSL